MFTQCPQCEAIFQLTASQLKAANGDVRCGQCLSVFNALNHLSEEAPDTQAADVTEDAVHDADPYSDWSPNSADETEATQTEASEDVFSEVIAEASSVSIPAEEFEQFEKFLDADALPADDKPTVEGAPEEHFVAKAAADISEEAQPISEEIPLTPEETPFTTSNDEALRIEKVPQDDTISVNANDAFSSDEVATDDTRFGDVDEVTADLTAKVSIDDDEFAELDAFLNDTDDKPAQDTSSIAAEVKTPDDAIIIEATDLDPVTSSNYADTPDGVVAQHDKTDAANSIDAPDTAANQADAQTISIPTLILDDLHAAKAEQLRPSNMPWIAGSLMLMLVLVLQVVYHSRDELAKDASMRPWLIQMCDVINCTLSQPYDITQIEIIGRDVRTHPTARKALVVSTTLINNANFTQPFPLLTMTFSDINGTKIAQRRFAPREYLDNNIDFDAGMIPDMPVRIELELVDPGKAAVNYEFRAELDPRRTRPIT